MGQESIRIVLSTIVVTLLITPPLLSLVFILLLIRKNVILVGKILKKEWNPISLIGTFTALDKLYDKPNNSAVITFGFKGMREYKVFVKRLEQAVNMKVTTDHSGPWLSFFPCLIFTLAP